MWCNEQCRIITKSRTNNCALYVFNCLSPSFLFSHSISLSILRLFCKILFNNLKACFHKVHTYKATEWTIFLYKSKILTKSVHSFSTHYDISNQYFNKNHNFISLIIYTLLCNFLIFTWWFNEMLPICLKRRIRKPKICS